MVTVRDQWARFPLYQPLIATTYNFDWTTLSSVITLDRGRRTGSIIIADKDCHREAGIPNPSPRYLGDSYTLWPANSIEGAFHPKVAIGFEEQDLLLLVGSHNLTQTSVDYNLEITSLLKIPITEPHRPLLENIAEFIEGIEGCLPSEHTARYELQNFRNRIKDVDPGNVKILPHIFIHSFEEPILTQVINHIPKIERVLILTPTHSSNPSFIKEALNLIGGKAKFIVDPSRFYISQEAKKTYEHYEVERLYNTDNRPLHAKLYVFHTEKGDWVLYGSPNFTEAALLKSAKNGGNVESVCLIPPSENWSWENLFQKLVNTTKIQWDEIPATEQPEESNKKQVLVEKWGYETISGKAVIPSPGLQEGTLVYVYLQGIDEKLKVEVVNGKIVFNIPPNWTESTRYEVFDSNGNILATGYLNRFGAAVPKLEVYDIDETARYIIWLYMHRLQQPKPKWLDFFRKETPYPDVVIDPDSWKRAEPIDRWFPVSCQLRSMNPEDFYSEAKAKLLEILNGFLATPISNDINIRFIRHLLVALDLLIEGAFYEALFTKSNGCLVYLATDLSKWMNLSCESDPLMVMNKGWRPYFLKPFNESLLEQWNRYALRFCIDIGVLFNYWVYIHRRGIISIDERSLDSVIITNKYYQICQGLHLLIKDKSPKASVESVWDNRIKLLQANRKIPLPSDQEELESCLQIAFERCKYKLK